MEGKISDFQILPTEHAVCATLSSGTKEVLSFILYKQILLLPGVYNDRRV